MWKTKLSNLSLYIVQPGRTFKAIATAERVNLNAMPSQERDQVWQQYYGLTEMTIGETVGQ